MMKIKIKEKNMRNFKKLSLICMTIVLAFSFLISPFPKKAQNKTTTAADNEIQLIDNNVLKYVTISTADKVLTTENFKTVDTNNDNKLDTSYIIANKTITIEFKPLEYSYSVEFNNDYFYETSDKITLRKEADDLAFPNTFPYKDQEYSYSISASADKTVTVRNAKTNSSVTASKLIKITDDENIRTITIITSYTLKANAPNTTLKFSASSSNVSLATTKYVLNFERPIVDFKTKNIAYFVAYFDNQEISDNVFKNNSLQDELSYENVKMQITNNNYTENNPLYFEINHNGFIYTFKLYNKEIGDPAQKLLFVEYYDEQRSNNNTSLATKLSEEGNVETPVSAFNDDGSNNMFSIDFNKTGRYEISIYDSTYLLLKNQPEIVEKEIVNEKGEKEIITEIVEPEDNEYNYNLFKTSFYIKTKDDAGSSENAAFKNVYVTMQSYDDDNNVLDYIVSKATNKIVDASGEINNRNDDTEITPTLNSNVQIRIKNLLYYFDNDEVVKNFTPVATQEELYLVEFKKTIFTSSSHKPQSKLYSKEELKKLASNNGDITINCEDDAFYEIIIYRYDNRYKIVEENVYQFTIVKQPKTIYTYFKVNDKNDPIIGSDGKKETDNYETNTPYQTETRNYKININSVMEFSTFMCDQSFETMEVDNIQELARSSFDLSKTYLNEYSITYAMQAVAIEEVEFGEDSEDEGKLGLKFLGIGDIIVKVTVNSVTTTYNVKSGDVLAFEEYGTYSVSIEDSIGTFDTKTFKHSKPVSTSAIILVALIGVIVLAVALFVISSRGRVKTR